MGILNLRKKIASKDAKAKGETPKKLSIVPVAASDTPFPSDPSYSRILVRPRIAEKATYLSEKMNAYVFEVAESATKQSIASAVRAIYKVTPRKIAIVPIPRKRFLSRGRVGFQRGGKKAYVYLKKGETIEIL